MVVAALAFNDDGGVVQTGHVLAAGAPGVGFLDAAGERALAAHGNAARGTGRGGAEHARREDQLVFGTQGMPGGGHFPADDRGGQGAAREARVFAQTLFPDPGAALGAHINA